MAQFNLPTSNKNFFTDKKLKRNPADYFGERTAKSAPVEFSQIREDSYELFENFRTSVSEIENVTEDMDRVVQDAKALGWKGQGLHDYIPAVDDKFINKRYTSDIQQRILQDTDPSSANFIEEFKGSVLGGQHLNEKLKYINNDIQKWLDENPELRGSPQGGFRDYSYYFNARKTQLADLEQKEIINRMYADNGFFLPTMLGNMQGAFTDPVIWGTIPLSMATGGNFSTLSGLAKIAFTEGALSTIAETGIQTKVVPYNQRLGSDYSWDDAMSAIVAAGVGGFFLAPAIGGVPAYTIKGFKKGMNEILKKTESGRLKLFSKELNKMIDESDISDQEFNKKFFSYINQSFNQFNAKELKEIFEAIPESSKNSTIKTAESILDGDLILEEQNPLEKTIAGKIEHIERVQKAGEDLFKGKEISISDNPNTPLDLEADPHSGKSIIRFQKLDPDQIDVDPKTFQFKTGGDEFGVSSKLKSENVWNQDAANVMMIYEYADGRKVIADGHQRLGLAKKIKAQKDGQKPYILATVRREVDGWTEGETMAEAMFINIYNGTANASDVARVLKVSPEYLDNIRGALGDSSILRHGIGLSKLDPIAWEFYLSKNIPDRVAAAVGDKVVDADLHSKILEYLSKTNFDNIDQINSAIDEILSAGTTIKKVQDLFGSQEFKELLIEERVKVLDLSIKDLKKDKGISAFLLKNDESITKSGKNKLDSSYNQTVLDETSVAIEKIKKLANMKGTLSDELTEAAKAYKNGSKQEAIKSFKTAVRGSIERGDYKGISTGGNERLSVSEGYTQIQTKKPKESETSKSLKDYSNPHDTNNFTKVVDDEISQSLNIDINNEKEITDFISKLDPEKEILVGGDGEKIIMKKTKDVIEDIADDKKIINALKDCDGLK